ncbi:flagellar hook protein FlgE [Cellvibrio polysaccharolyticus]|uniref:Flagellar hook protein FlgE n=1 Tax=Cellvibrio polysaccharolyticus TaxID=2082724 RepID=A0A928UZ95_9GAMM|nr:flagellar hook protein FlgE [Cellvibrio polysaccharolyticus]MBE8715793.1 flagellar basal body protein FlaE [Cellvibrio polysaccharolyticus]
MSFNIALSGLNAVSEGLNTISNNIANVSTTGFKSSRTEFGSIYSDSQAMGVQVMGTTQSITQGGPVTTTGRSMDLAIAGGGFFVTKSSTGETNYTRAGVFGTDKENFIVSAAGQKLQGFPVDAQNTLQVGSVSDLKLQNGNIAATATDRVNFVANLNANDTIPSLATFDPAQADSYNSTYTSKIFDSQGKEHTLTQYFVKTGDNAWTAHYYVDGTDTTNSIGTQNLVFNTDGYMTQPYNYAGVLAQQNPLNPAHADVELDIPAALLGGGVADITLQVNYGGDGIGGATQFGSSFLVSTNAPNGYTSGEQTGIAIEKNGMVYATYSNGQRQLQGQVILASFANAGGLANENGTTWKETSESGGALVGVPGVGPFGAVTAGSLESSNVDLTQQLVNLMEGQRNYQANTKVLSTNKELTQVLFSSI